MKVWKAWKVFEVKRKNMLHHIIVKWNNTADKKALASEVKDLFRNATEIQGIIEVQIKENIIPRDNRYDLMIVLNIDEDSLTIWDNSELHKKWKAEYGSIIEKKCIFDSESV